MVRNLISRINAWWVMIIIFFLAMATGGVGSVILFGMTSFLALREYITLTPTHQADHRALFWAFFIFTPLQYVLIAYHNYPIAVRDGKTHRLRAVVARGCCRNHIGRMSPDEIALHRADEPR